MISQISNRLLKEDRKKKNQTIASENGYLKRNVFDNKV